MKDYWPNFHPADQVRTPLNELQEQAALLPEKTDGLVGATVNCWGEDDRVHAALLLTSSDEPQYRYELFTMSYPLDYYPLKILAGDATYEARNEQEYLRALREVLGSDRTRRIVEAIMAHMKRRSATSATA